jgi:hypothetical protein
MSDYKVNLDVLVNHSAALSALTALSAKLAGIAGTVAHLNGTNGFGAWGNLFKSAGLALASAGIVAGLVKMVEHSKELNSELARLKNLGGDMTKAVDSGAAYSLSSRIASQTGLKTEDVAKIYGDAYTVMGDKEAQALLPHLAKASQVLKHHGASSDGLYDLIKAGEQAGLLTDAKGNFDEEKAKHFVDIAVRGAIATHGKVGPKELFNLTKTAGASLRGMSDEGIENVLIASQAMGGFRAGTALYSTWQQLGGGRMTRATAEAMQNYGLLKEGEWSESKGGRALLTEDAKKRLGGLIGTDMMQFVHAIDEELTKRGITDPAERMRAVMSISGRQTTGRLLEEGVANYQQIAAQRGRMGEAANTDTAFLNYQKTLEFNMNALANAWSNLINAVAQPGTDVVVKMLTSLTGALDGLKGLSETNPAVVTAFFQGAIALAAGLAGLSVAALVALGGIPGLIVGVVSGVAALAALHWDSVRDGLKTVSTAFDNFFSWLTGIAEKIAAFVKSLPSKIFGGESKPLTMDDQGLLHQQSFRPGPGQTKATPISLTLNIDGRRLAQAVTEGQLSSNRYERTAADFNGASVWANA